VLIDEDSGIIAGHGRVLAAQTLGILELPVFYVPDALPIPRHLRRFALRGLPPPARLDCAAFEREPPS
jgi:hypothetical protein